MSTQEQPEPFLKWPGGKRALLSSIVPHLPRRFGSYFEPFVGSAALFFRLSPPSATLTDINPELINVYEIVRDEVDAVIKRLERLEISQNEYYRIRSWRPRTPLSRAVRFLYLNRTAFNGIYRVNRRGEFNVPFGCKPGTVLCDADNLRRVSRLLNRVRLHCSDFAHVFEMASPGDLIYADPPYTTLHDKNGFRRYNESIFSWADQVRLATAAAQAARRGVTVAVSNANHADVLSLYPHFRRILVTRASCISAHAIARKQVTELVLLSV